MVRQTCDIAIVGAGIVGLTLAHEILQRRPATRIVVVDKEDRPGRHASSRNSGVLHSGIYYASDTLKARLCAEGARRMIAFAHDKGIACRPCGKVILAVSENELPTIETLLRNARENDILAEIVDTCRLRELEPYAAPSTAAIHCPSTAVIDSAAVMARLRARLAQKGVHFIFDSPFRGTSSRCFATHEGELKYGFLFNCAGAYADRIAKGFGLAQDYALVPFKGIYWKLTPEASQRVRANIYPVPDISLPFLGVHLTRVISGDVYVGPTAIPALGRENYSPLVGIRAMEAIQVAKHLFGMYVRDVNNFRSLARVELAKYQKSNFLAAARKLMPSLTAADMLPTSKVGIRPQLMNTRTHRLEMDYILERGEDSLHVLNSISPAFTCGFAFAQLIADKSGVV